MVRTPQPPSRDFPAHQIRELLRWPDGSSELRTAVSFAGVDLSYGALDTRSLEIAAGLERSGLGKGDRLAAFLPNCLEIYELYFATASARGIFMAINQALSIPEMAYLLGHAKPGMVFTMPDRRAVLQEAMALAGHSAQLFELDPTMPSGSRLEFLAVPGGTPKAIPSPEDIVLITYSSGTTSTPKAVAVSNRVEVNACELYRDAWALGPTDRVLIVLSLGWTYGINPGSFPALRAGAHIVLMEKFNPIAVLEAIEAQRITVFMGVPTMYAMMVEHVQQTGKEYDLSSLRLVLCAGAELTVALVDKFKEIFGIGITNFLGISEVKLVASPRAELDDVVPPGSVGRIPPSVEVRLVDEQGNDVPVGETGEILVRSPGMMTGYFLDPEKTASVVRDGWFISGDLGRFDESGFFYVVGRNRDQIIRGGAKVAPVEVEDVLGAHPAVALAAVIGVPDPLYGEEIKAFVVSRDRSLTKEELQEFCRSRLSAFKIPGRIEFVSALPLGPTGKILKNELRQL